MIKFFGLALIVALVSATALAQNAPETPAVSLEQLTEAILRLEEEVDTLSTRLDRLDNRAWVTSRGHLGESTAVAMVGIAMRNGSAGGGAGGNFYEQEEFLRDLQQIEGAILTATQTNVELAVPATPYGLELLTKPLVQNNLDPATPLVFYYPENSLEDATQLLGSLPSTTESVTRPYINNGLQFEIPYGTLENPSFIENFGLESIE